MYNTSDNKYQFSTISKGVYITFTDKKFLDKLNIYGSQKRLVITSFRCKII